MGMTNHAKNKLADYLRGADFGAIGSWWLALASAADVDGITELAGEGYARKEVVASLETFAGTQGPGSTLPSTGASHGTSNNAPVNFGTATAAWGTVTYIGFMDAETDGNCWFWVPVEQPVVVNASDQVAFPAGSIQLVIGLTGGLANPFANKLVDRLFRGQAGTPATEWAIGYTTTVPTNSTPGVEPGVGSYARAAFLPHFGSLSSTVGPGDTGPSDGGTSGLIANMEEIVWPTPTANQGNVTHYQIFDADGQYMFWHALQSPKTMSTGGLPPRFEPGSLEFLFT